MKYLKKFDSEKAYKSFTEMLDYPLPNVCLVEDNVIINSSDTPFYVEAVEDLVIYPTKTWFLYSYDNENWEALTTSSSTSPVHTAGRKVFIKASGYSISSSAGIGTLRFSGRCKVGGNIRLMLTETLHDNTVALPSYTFYRLFYNATSLVSAKDLVIDGPMNSYVCYEMFYGCSSLVEPPIILTRKLVDATYTFYQTFYGCSSLIEAPVIRIVDANINSKKTFIGMFRGCTSLSYIKVLANFSSMSSSGAFNYWVTDVASNGVFVINSEADATTKWSTSNMPAGWEKKLCDIDTGLTFIRFKIGSTSYQADDEMTWEEWVASDYNTAGLTSDGTNIISDAGTLLLGGNAVLATDFVKCIIGTDYTIGTVTETTTE